MMPSPSVPAFETVPKMLVALAHGSNEPMVIAPAPASIRLRAVESAVDTGAGGGGGGGIGAGPGACSGGYHLPSLATHQPGPWLWSLIPSRLSLSASSPQRTGRVVRPSLALPRAPAASSSDSTTASVASHGLRHPGTRANEKTETT